jgi:hypothetical protein
MIRKITRVVNLSDYGANTFHSPTTGSQMALAASPPSRTLWVAAT